MRSMTKSPVALAQTALKIGQDALPLYSSKFSRHDYTQAQLFAILVLRQFFKTDYRGIVQILQDFPSLRETLQLPKVPDHSSLWYAEERLLKKGLLKAS